MWKSLYYSKIMEIKEKKLANNMSSIVKIDHQIYNKFETSILRYSKLIRSKIGFHVKTAKE